MDDLGAPIAYLVLRDGTPVYDRSGNRVGVVEHVLADEEVDIFHGLIIRTGSGRERHLYAAREYVGQIHERGVLLTVDAAQLPEPAAPQSPGAGQAGAGAGESALEAELRRAWDWLSGNR